MALPPLAPISELERRIGRSIDPGAERERAAALISDASTLVRHEASATWVDADGELIAVPDLAVTIALAAALRGWYNPAAIESTQLGAVSVRYADVWLTATERDRLGSLGATGFQSITMRHGYGFDGPDRWGYAPVAHGDNDLGADAADWFPIGY